jgi:hypothetical protein
MARPTHSARAVVPTQNVRAKKSAKKRKKSLLAASNLANNHVTQLAKSECLEKKSGAEAPRQVRRNLIQL